MPRKDGNTQKKQNKHIVEQEVSSNTSSKRNYRAFKNNEKNKKKNTWKSPRVSANNKVKLFFAKKPENIYGDPYEYQMSRECANDILKECPKNIHPQQYLCDFVTEQYGLIGWCQRVIIKG